MGSEFVFENLCFLLCFFVWVIWDVNGGWLQCVQIIKGWIENGECREKIYDVVCFDGFFFDLEIYCCFDNGVVVDLIDCSIFEDKGVIELKVFWEDFDFDFDMYVFYYVWVLENFLCCWFIWDVLCNGMLICFGLYLVIQEWVWSLLIWIIFEG